MFWINLANFIFQSQIFAFNFADYVADVRNVMFNRTDEEFELILQNYKDKEPAPLNTQFPDRRSKVDAIERKLQRSRASSQLFPAGRLIDDL